MNEGLYGQVAGAALKVSRVRYLVGYSGAARTLGEAIIIASSDDLSGQTTRYKGGTSSSVDRVDMVLQVPVAKGAYGQSNAGAGSLSAQLPDGLLTGGNRRGIGAVDLQVVRNTATQVASGDYSVVMGGGNTTSGTYSVAMGRFCTVSGTHSVAMGSFCTASGTNSLAVGSSATANGSYAVALGNSVLAGGVNSFATGDSASTQSITGKRAHSSLSAAGVGGSQVTYVPLYAGTTNTTPTTMTSTGAVSGTSNQMVLPNSSAFAFTGTVVARQKTSDGTASAAWKIEGLIRRDANAASTTLVASTVTAISNVPGWTLALSADTTNGALAVTFTGAAATNIRATGVVYASEIIYA